jgi:hypothetical protein
MSIGLARRYRATLIPKTVPLHEAVVKADQGVLPTLQFKAANSGQAELIAHAVSGLPVLRVERIEGAA